MSQYLPDWVFELRDRIPTLLASYSAGRPGWYRGQVSNQEIINGTMKIMKGLYWWGKPCSYDEILSRTASQNINGSGDCTIANRLFVLYRLSEQLGQIPPGASQIAKASLETIPEFFQSDGGLSSSKKGSLQHYYTVRVSQGKHVGDIHGLFLFTWSITMAAYLLGEQERLAWKLVAP